MDSHRQLIMCGKMKRSNNSSWDIQVFLFDHYLVCCKIKYQDGLEYYKMYQKVKKKKSVCHTCKTKFNLFFF